MQVIVYDLETTVIYKKGQTQEIVEIGAVKFDLDQLDISAEKQFQKFVFPPLRGYFDNRTRKFAGITDENVASAVTFRQAFTDFIEWMGSDYYICSWGPDDKRLLMEHCARFGVTFNWLRNYNDVQPPISMLLVDRQQMGLNKAIEMSGLETLGRLHSALDDARNTAAVLKKYLDKIELKTNVPDDHFGDSCQLYLTCKKCGTEKMYGEMSRRRGVCSACVKKYYQRPNQNPNQPSSE
ncbi:3'-5' exonuclease [Brevibacillus dissolubilis]|uniref:3'-5' exonuclease n=1 Tax=Brevibacillus dissolubilis TaxID=1844116 RepID=UPI0011171769|nr:3'-5' exonuclease [Brevibacillus dissolubilis]